MFKLLGPVSLVVFAAIGTGFLYLIPLVRHLVWLNAGAVAAECNKPWLFVPVAAAELILMTAVLAFAALSLANLRRK